VLASSVKRASTGRRLEGPAPGSVSSDVGVARAAARSRLRVPHARALRLRTFGSFRSSRSRCSVAARSSASRRSCSSRSRCSAAARSSASRRSCSSRSRCSAAARSSASRRSCSSRSRCSAAACSSASRRSCSHGRVAPPQHVPRTRGVPALPGRVARRARSSASRRSCFPVALFAAARSSASRRSCSSGRVVRQRRLFSFAAFLLFRSRCSARRARRLRGVPVLPGRVVRQRRALQLRGVPVLPGPVVRGGTFLGFAAFLLLALTLFRGGTFFCFALLSFAYFGVVRSGCRFNAGSASKSATGASIRSSVIMSEIVGRLFVRRDREVRFELASSISAAARPSLTGASNSSPSEVSIEAASPLRARLLDVRRGYNVLPAFGASKSSSRKSSSSPRSFSRAT